MKRTVAEIVRSRGLRFSIVFTLSCIGLYALVYALPEVFTRPINEHTARALGFFLNGLGIPASAVGDVVSENGLAFKIIPECTPIFTAGLFISFIVFHPAAVRQKAVGLVLGIPALYLGNLFRLVVTFMVSRYDRRFFEIFHVYLGQVFTLFLVILCCILWMRWIERGEAEDNGTAPDIAFFLARFCLISAGVFFVWLKVHLVYIRLLDQCMAFGFSLFDRTANLSHETPVYYETFSIVIVVSLVLAASSLPWRRRMPLLGAGLGVLFFGHLFHRIDNALMVLYSVSTMQAADLTFLVIGQYVVPVLLLMYLVRLQQQSVPAVFA